MGHLLFLFASFVTAHAKCEGASSMCQVTSQQSCEAMAKTGADCVWGGAAGQAIDPIALGFTALAIAAVAVAKAVRDSAREDAEIEADTQAAHEKEKEKKIYSNRGPSRGW